MQPHVAVDLLQAVCVSFGMSSNIKRKLSAIMFTDIYQFTKIMGGDESTALSILKNQESLLNPIIDKYNGNIVKKTGDGYLLEFNSSVEAVECSILIQESIKEYNLNKDNIEFHIRIGIHLGDIIILENNDILGDGVNIASRIEPLANPDGICLTEAVYQSVKSKLSINPRRIDEVELKHIDDKYTIYQLPNENDIKMDNEDVNKIHKAIIEISRIKNKTKIFKEYSLTLFKLNLAMIAGMLSVALISNILYFFGVIEKVAPFSVIPKILLESYLILVGIIASFMFFKLKYKIQFKDIRNVTTLLDILILNHGYEFVKKSENTIEYVHVPKWSFFANFITRSKYGKWFGREMAILRIFFNGNTVEIKGMAYHVISLLRNLKKHSNSPRIVSL